MDLTEHIRQHVGKPQTLATLGRHANNDLIFSNQEICNWPKMRYRRNVAIPNSLALSGPIRFRS
jgi:hypothetical protein